jgi:hypothetical protein
MKSKHKSVKFSKAEGIFKLKPSVRLRLIVAGVAFHMTVKDISMGFTTQMRAVEDAQNELARLMGLGEACIGLGGTWHDTQVQIDVVRS